MPRFFWTTGHVVFLYFCGVLLGAALLDFGMNMLQEEGFYLGGFLVLILAMGLPVLPATHAHHLASDGED